MKIMTWISLITTFEFLLGTYQNFYKVWLKCRSLSCRGAYQANQRRPAVTKEEWFLAQLIIWREKFEEAISRKMLSIL